MKPLRLVRREYDDDGSYIPSPEFYKSKPMELPEDMAERQVEEARAFLAQIRAGHHLRFPWPDVDRLIGPMLPGWFVAVGGRAKAGKTTFLRDCLTAWTEQGKTVVYVGTETEVAALRLSWAASRCGLSFADVLDGNNPEADRQLLADLGRQKGQAYRAIFGEIGEGTVDDLGYWVEYARIGHADALIFDHLHMLDVGPGEEWRGLGRAVKAIKTMARDGKLLVVAGAQLTQGEGGSVLGEHEVPGNGSWAGSSGIQRLVDAGIQLWKPFHKGVTPQQKREARDEPGKIADIVQRNVMAVRVAAHRWRQGAMNQFAKLYVEQDQVHSWTSR